jgi:hypothetical protein
MKIDELRSEYRRSDFPQGFVRGKYVQRDREAICEVCHVADERERKLLVLRTALIDGENSGWTTLDVDTIKSKARAFQQSRERKKT